MEGFWIFADHHPWALATCFCAFVGAVVAIYRADS